jgi:hypothetical protein
MVFRLLCSELLLCESSLRTAKIAAAFASKAGVGVLMESFGGGFKDAATIVLDLETKR